MTKPPKKAYASPSVLQPFDADEKFVQVVIETPRGSRNKYKFEPKLGSMKLNKVLPAGMEFPYDFGFVPSTRAEDGDPIDVLLLMDEQVFPGCVVESRLIGVIEGEQEEDGQTTRNDRLVAVAKESHTHSDLKDLADVNRELLKEVGEFFTNYHQLSGAKFKVLGYKGTKEARRRLDKAIQRAA
jgi:inorganic pyrophosphatase